MLDDPYALRAYAPPAAERAALALTDDLPHASGPLRLYVQRLLLLAIVFYAVLALLFVVNSRSFAAPLDVSAAAVLVDSQGQSAAD